MSDALLGEMVHASRYLTGHHHKVLRCQHLLGRGRGGGGSERESGRERERERGGGGGGGEEEKDEERERERENKVTTREEKWRGNSMKPHTSSTSSP